MNDKRAGTPGVYRKIGLTGGIASGKTSVAGILSEILACEHIDADEICRRLLEPNKEGWQQFTKEFGKEYLHRDGTINRGLLRQDLFDSEEFRCKVNAIIHPLARKEIVAGMNAIIESDPLAKVLVEVPLLYEVQWENLFDTVVVVYADYETCLHRLMKRDEKNMAEAMKELQSQWPLDEKARLADHVINNSGLQSDTEGQLRHLAEILNK